MSEPDDRKPPHDTSGLDLARSVAAGLRGLGRNRVRALGATLARRSTPTFSGASPDARDPALLGEVVNRFVMENGWATDLAVHGIFGRWESIVGQEVAAHCRPEAFTEGLVSVRTDSTAWATQLRLLAPTIVRRLNEELGSGTVLRIEVQGPETPSWRRGRRSVRGGRGPRDTYG